jgi:succinoglycan biosynthesis protein ExoA
LRVLLLAYVLGVAAMSALVVHEARATLGFDRHAAVRVPLAIAAYHLSYGAGSLLGAWDAWRHGRGRERFAVLTR